MEFDIHNLYQATMRYLAGTTERWGSAGLAYPSTSCRDADAAREFVAMTLRLSELSPETFRQSAEEALVFLADFHNAPSLVLFPLLYIFAVVVFRMAFSSADGQLPPTGPAGLRNRFFRRWLWGMLGLATFFFACNSYYPDLLRLTALIIFVPCVLFFYALDPGEAEAASGRVLIRKANDFGVPLVIVLLFSVLAWCTWHLSDRTEQAMPGLLGLGALVLALVSTRVRSWGRVSAGLDLVAAALLLVGFSHFKTAPAASMTTTDAVVGVLALIWVLRFVVWRFRGRLSQWLEQARQARRKKTWHQRMIGGPLKQTAGWVLGYGIFVFALFYNGADWSAGGILKWLVRGWAFVIVTIMPPGMMLMLLLQASRSSSVLAGRPERARKSMFEAVLVIIYLFLAFAVVFANFGLKDTVCDKTVMTCDPHSGWLALYFTVVTWTTLGYGDVLPDPATYGRAFAAWAAFCGYVIMAFLIAAFVSLAGIRRDPDPSTKVSS